MNRKYESYEDLISGLEHEGIVSDEVDIGGLDDEDINTLMPVRRPVKPTPAPAKKRKVK